MPEKNNSQPERAPQTNPSSIAGAQGGPSLPTTPMPAGLQNLWQPPEWVKITAALVIPYVALILLVWFLSNIPQRMGGSGFEDWTPPAKS